MSAADDIEAIGDAIILAELLAPGDARRIEYAAKARLLFARMSAAVMRLGPHVEELERQVTHLARYRQLLAEGLDGEQLADAGDEIARPNAH